MTDSTQFINAVPSFRRLPGGICEAFPIIGDEVCRTFTSPLSFSAIIRKESEHLGAFARFSGILGD